MSELDIICERVGITGFIRLNRPQALNALTLAMTRSLRFHLDRWAHDPLLERVVIKAEGGRAFCAGGDIRQLYEWGKAGRIEDAYQFFYEEYQLNYVIKHYPKPYIALINGLVMGGGVGISIHGSHVIAGDRFEFAMPEVGIGFIPDVGATHLLSRLSHNAGLYLGLTGIKIGVQQAYRLGLVTECVDDRVFDAIEKSLLSGKPLDEILACYSHVKMPALDSSNDIETSDVGSSDIEYCFGSENIKGVIERLSQRQTAFTDLTLKTLLSRSPLSISLVFEQMRRGRSLDFYNALKLEYTLVCRLLNAPDFYEGVRAVIIDKDHKPLWQHSHIDQVSDMLVQSYFEPFEARPFDKPDVRQDV